MSREDRSFKRMRGVDLSLDVSTCSGLLICFTDLNALFS